MADEDPRRRQRAHGRSEHVDPVEEPDGLARRRRVAHHRAGEERQGHPHEGGGKGEARELHEAGSQRLGDTPTPADVEPVVVEGAAHRPEGGDRQLAAREESQRTGTGDASAHHRAQVAPDPEAQQERGDDDGDRVEADARLQGQDALPGHLIR